MRDGPIKIAQVEAGSIAEEVGIVPGDVLMQIDGKNIEDIFDYRFLCAAETLVVTIQKADGEVWEVDMEKDFEDDLGLVFEHPMITAETSCTNKCVFCFIDQLPPGMRETLYFKDDDTRLSFLTGNYVTLTNMKDEELDRIIRYRLSPINVSVHATDAALRKELLGNRFAGRILEQIKKITDAGLTVNAQIVVCPGRNDGAALDRSMQDLSALYPGLNSVSVVPVGLTRFREGLPLVNGFDETAARTVLQQVERVQIDNRKKFGSRIVFAADELYVKAKVEVPDYEAYEEFPQIENGVGLIASLQEEVDEVCKLLATMPKQTIERNVLIATGLAAEPLIKKLAQQVSSLVEGLEVKVLGVKNEFFGASVTVCGLLTGQDVIKEVLAAKARGSKARVLMLCASMFREGEDVFLDDVTLEECERQTGMQVLVTDNLGVQFVAHLTGMEIEMGFEEEGRVD